MAKRSSVQGLPTEIRAWLDTTLVEGNFSGYKLLEAELKERGYEIGKSSIQRYGTKLERRLAAVKASTDAARAIAEGAPDEQDHKSAATIALVQSDLFEALLSLQEAEDEDDPAERVKILSKAARGIAEVAKASITQKKFAQEVRRQALKDAADKVEETAKQAGVSPETIQIIRRDVLRMAS